MPQKSFTEFVTEIAAACDDYESMIGEDLEIRRIYGRALPYRDRVDAAVSHWKFKRPIRS